MEATYIFGQNASLTITNPNGSGFFFEGGDQAATNAVTIDYIFHPIVNGVVMPTVTLFTLEIPGGGGVNLQGAPAAGTVIMAGPGSRLVARVSAGGDDPSIANQDTAILWNLV